MKCEQMFQIFFLIFLNLLFFYTNGSKAGVKYDKSVTTRKYGTVLCSVVSSSSSLVLCDLTPLSTELASCGKL
jgi:hypothetical protein